MTTWIAAAALSFAVFALAAWVHRARSDHRTCPTCEVPYEVVADAGHGPNETYDVLACPRCANTATLVHGARSHLAYCPACGNRSLETPTVRLPGDPPRVEVRERCHLCEYTQTFTLGAPETSALGKVLVFPTERVRRRSGEAGQ